MNKQTKKKKKRKKTHATLQTLNICNPSLVAHRFWLKYPFGVSISLPSDGIN